MQNGFQALCFLFDEIMTVYKANYALCFFFFKLENYCAQHILKSRCLHCGRLTEDSSGPLSVQAQLEQRGEFKSWRVPTL